MRDFDYLEPTSVQEASGLLHEHGDEARLIAGGTALILALRQRLVMPHKLISLSRLQALQGIREEDGGLSIGAGVTHTALAASELVQRFVPTLAALAGKLANEQVRNQGTLGGNLAYADPTTDPPGCLVAMDAQVILEGRAGARTLPMAAFLVDYFETALRPDEILTRIQIPAAAAQGQTTYLRHLRTPADHRPMANVSVHTDAQRRDIRVVIGAATPMPWSVPFASELMRGSRRPEDLQAFAAQAASDMQALSDTRCDSEYRRDVVRVLLTRALTRHFCNEDEVTS